MIMLSWNKATIAPGAYGELDPVYYEAARKLKQGQISGIVRSQYGYHIIKLTGVRTFAETDKAKIKRLAFQERKQKLFDDYMKNLRLKSKVVINTKLIK